jgi:hypothetical protein
MAGANLHHRSQAGTVSQAAGKSSGDTLRGRITDDPVSARPDIGVLPSHQQAP